MHSSSLNDFRVHSVIQQTSVSCSQHGTNQAAFPSPRAQPSQASALCKGCTPSVPAVLRQCPHSAGSPAEHGQLCRQAHGPRHASCHLLRQMPSAPAGCSSAPTCHSATGMHPTPLICNAVLYFCVMRGGTQHCKVLA